MTKILSKQAYVPFIYCPSPIVIDKRKEWGPAEDNFQNAPDGAFLKVADNGTISHLVQPNADNTAPVGWETSGQPNLFTKLPIMVEDEVLQPGSTISLTTLDGTIKYEVKEPSMVCYNLDSNGLANLNDVWVQSVKNLEKNYFL